MRAFHCTGKPSLSFFIVIIIFKNRGEKGRERERDKDNEKFTVCLKIKRKIMRGPKGIDKNYSKKIIKTE